MATHKLLKKLNVTATQVFDAITHGFRAETDVKGKLAELFLAAHLDKMKQTGAIEAYEWFDKDNIPDFRVILPDGASFWLECKNVRSPKGRALPAATGIPLFCDVEVRKSRDGKGKDGKSTRNYKSKHFDVLAACTFNQDPAKSWNFRFTHVDHLTRDEDGRVHKDQTVDVYGAGGHWHGDLIDAYKDATVESAVPPNSAAA